MPTAHLRSPSARDISRSVRLPVQGCRLLGESAKAIRALTLSGASTTLVMIQVTLIRPRLPSTSSPGRAPQLLAHQPCLLLGAADIGKVISPSSASRVEVPQCLPVPYQPGSGDVSRAPARLQAFPFRSRGPSSPSCRLAKRPTAHQVRLWHLLHHLGDSLAALDPTRALLLSGTHTISATFLERPHPGVNYPTARARA